MEENEYYKEWVEEHRTDLEIEFLETYADNQVLDDDIPDFLDDHVEEFEEFCADQFSLADHEIYPKDE